MDDSMDRAFLDIVGLLKSWIPWRSEPSNVSRDFWMPDQCCMVCYECDTQFTLFNRRHHCRLCGRIFCAKCTSNWIPAPSSQPCTLHQEDREKVRVCNYCFKQWEQSLAAPADNGTRVVDLESSTSVSATSFISFKSSRTGDSSSITVASVPYSAAELSPRQAAVVESSIDKQSFTTARGSADMGVSDGCAFYTARSDDEEEEYDNYQFGSQTNHSSKSNGYYNRVPFDGLGKDFGSPKVHPNGEAVDTKSVNNSSAHNSMDSQTSEEVEQIVRKEGESDVGYECDTSSSIYAAENVSSAEPVDFENNGVLWLPPEPEDEEDEREALLFDDDDDGDAAGEWGALRASSSFGSGEYKNKDKSSEENKKARKHVVDGHFRALVAQLMHVESLPTGEENEKDNWLDIITSLSWEAATLLKPYTSKGGGMDPGGYVKVKCIASGHCSDSMVVKGIVCKKNVAHRRMASKIEKPRILILGGALEYQRVSNLLSSVDTLLQQETDHLKMAVAKIDAHQPDILLVEKSVSRYAQDYLLAKEISLVLNIKKPLLERIARCTGCQIVPSIDQLSSQKLGYCDLFHVEKFTEEHDAAGRSGKKLMKTLMYFEGCPKPLGCTVLLRGANSEELKKVKHVVQYSIFAAYHLALETSFLADEGATLPELPLESPITVTLPDKTSTVVRSISTIPGFSVPSSEKTQGPPLSGEPQRLLSAPTVLAETANPCAEKVEATDFATLYTSFSTKRIISSLTTSQQGIPNPLTVESSLYHAPDGGTKTSSGEEPLASNTIPENLRDHLVSNDCSLSGALELDVVYRNVQSTFNDTGANHIVSSPNLQQEEKHVLEEPGSLKEGFPPSSSDHQSILVSLSSRCVWKGTVCERSHLFRIKYYGNFDKPLGRFLRDHLFDQSYQCRSCEMPSEAHVQCYTHHQGTLTISVKKLPEILLPGEREGKIWMWHRCLKCPRFNGFPPATRRVVMSDAAWGLSFGKFLELSFSNHAAASRVASCGHSLHRDCLRFYGFGKMVACFRYASIDVHSVYLPPSKLDFNYENQDWIHQEVNEVVGRAELLFSEVLNALSSLAVRKCSAVLNNCIKVPPETRYQMTDLEGMLQKEKAEFEESLQKVLNKELKKGQPAVDIFEINRLRRQLLFQSYMWDHRLVYAASLDKENRCVDAVLCTSDVDKSGINNEKYSDPDIPIEPSKASSDSDLVSVSKQLEAGQEVTGSFTRQVNVDHQGGDVGFDSNNLVGNPMSHSFVVKGSESDLPLLRKVFSEGQFPNMENLSDTLEAAWTGESQVLVGPKDDLPTTDSSTNGVTEKLNTEDSGEEPIVPKLPVSSLLYSKGSENMEDSMSWLGMPFINFYRSLNKNFLGSAQKLDTLGEYNPVYISSFRGSDVQGSARLLLPMGVNDTVVPIYDDEPTSLIAYALVSPDYFAQLSDELDRKESADSTSPLQTFGSGNLQPLQSMDDIAFESYKSLSSVDEILSLSGSRSLDPQSNTKTVHARVSFVDDGPQGKTKYTVTCYYAKRFEALRRICCPSDMDFVRSLSRCKKWGAQGGKSNVFFAKTLDDRFIIKQVTKTELDSFTKFASGYFKYLSESISSGSPTCLAKILGIYQVSYKNLKGAKESKMDVLIMENLLFGRKITRLYDLKGSSRSRYNADSSGVLLDQNLIESMPTSPIFVGNKAKRVLERAVWNDTAFLASVDVMDYSLLVGIDEEKHELVLGIIDFMRQYTWDKHLETWVKSSGILGGPKNATPTVISPIQYKKRFRKAMTTYFLMIPDQWSSSIMVPSKSQTDLSEENTPSTTSAE